MFPKAFPECLTGLANALAWEGGIMFYERVQLIKYKRLPEEQDSFCKIFLCSPVCKIMYHER